MLKTLAGQPAHPVYVHFPVAFFILSSLVLGLHLLEGKSHWLNRVLEKIRLGTFDFESFSLFTLLLGCAGGVMAILSGLALAGNWRKIPLPHAPLGMATLACYSALLLIRWRSGQALYSRRLRFLYYALHLLGVALVIFTGFEGGELHSH